MKIVTVIGARPQFIKAAAVSSTIAVHNKKAVAQKNIKEVLLHTGQHYDPNMSDIFFQQLGLPVPVYNLGITASTHGAMTGRMLEQIETVLIEEKPDTVLVYGDTNSTLAGALAAAKLHIPVVHIEAGLRSFNRNMPEEVNRILTDHLADLLFAPTSAGVENLKAEGIVRGVHHTGDVMYDAALLFGEIADAKSKIIDKLELKPQQYFLATIHRAENTDDLTRLRSVLNALVTLNGYFPVVLPLHPRTAKMIDRFGFSNIAQQLYLTEPLSFFDMAALEKKALVIITDSGGVQKEAYFHSVPCVTLRDETKWTETVDAGWNSVVGADSEKIVYAV